MTVSLIARQLHQMRQGCLYCVILHCTGWAVLCTVSESLRPGPDITHLEVTHLVTRELHHGYHCPDVRPGAHHKSASRIVTHTWVTRGTGPRHTLVTIV